MATIKASIVNSWGIKLGYDLVQPYADTAVPQGVVVQAYGDAGALTSPLYQRWRDMVLTSQTLAQPWETTLSCSASLEQSWATLANNLISDSVQLWDEKDYDRVISALQQNWWNVAEGTVTDGGGILPVVTGPFGVLTSIVSLSITVSSEQFVISAEMELADLLEWSSLNSQDTVTISNVMGTTFELMVESVSHAKASDSRKYSVSLLSKTILLDLPYAQPITEEHSGMASDIATALCNGYSVQWGTVDWFLPEGLLFSDETAPIETLRRITSSVKAVIGTTPAGVLTVTPKYTIPVTEILVTDVELALTESDNVVSIEYDVEINPGYNSVLVSNEDVNNGNSLRVSVEEIDDFNKYVLVQTTPPRDVTLEHSGGAYITILAPEDLTVTVVDEVVEIVSGDGQLSNTFNSLTNYRWKDVDLGVPVFNQDGTVQTVNPEDSLLFVSYTYTHKRWLVRSTEAGPVQFIIEGA